METLAMETLVVDTEGRIIIPSEIALKRGLHPGDQIAVLETDEGLLVRPPAPLPIHIDDPEVRSWAENWWNSMTEEEKIEARKEAEEYEALSEEERDALWQEEPVSIEEDEGDEIDLAAIQRSAWNSAKNSA